MDLLDVSMIMTQNRPHLKDWRGLLVVKDVMDERKDITSSFLLWARERGGRHNSTFAPH